MRATTTAAAAAAAAAAATTTTTTTTAAATAAAATAAAATATTNAVATVYCHYHYCHLDGECGMSKYPDAGDQYLAPAVRIVGGEYCEPHEFPWQVTVYSTYYSQSPSSSNPTL